MNELIMIRTIQAEDAAAYLELCRGLDEETHFMLLEPGERTITVEEQRKKILSICAQENAAILVAETSGVLVGYIAVLGGSFQRNYRTAHMVIGIRQDYTGKGLGARLFAAAERWARQQGLHRLELTVMAHNARALRLYQKMGFQIEGLHRHSLFLEGKFVDEYGMAKLLE